MISYFIHDVDDFASYFRNLTNIQEAYLVAEAAAGYSHSDQRTGDMI